MIWMVWYRLYGMADSVGRRRFWGSEADWETRVGILVGGCWMDGGGRKVVPAAKYLSPLLSKQNLVSTLCVMVLWVLCSNY